MYPFERYLFASAIYVIIHYLIYRILFVVIATFIQVKGLYENKSTLEGSITEGYNVEECLVFVLLI